jgi:hypothetical protein
VWEDRESGRDSRAGQRDKRPPWRRTWRRTIGFSPVGSKQGLGGGTPDRGGSGTALGPAAPRRLRPVLERAKRRHGRVTPRAADRVFEVEVVEVVGGEKVAGECRLAGLAGAGQEDNWTTVQGGAEAVSGVAAGNLHLQKPCRTRGLPIRMYDTPSETWAADARHISRICSHVARTNRRVARCRSIGPRRASRQVTASALRSRRRRPVPRLTRTMVSSSAARSSGAVHRRLSRELW